MQDRRIERQAREVEQLRRRLMFELLVLERLGERGSGMVGASAPQARPGLSMPLVRARAEARAAKGLLAACRAAQEGER